MAESAPNPDKNTLIRAFNTHFFDFLNNIISVVPENSDIIVAKQFFETFKRANPTLIIKVWFQYIYAPYQAIIDGGDVEFICNKDYREDLVVFQNAKDFLEVINKLREPIRNMSEKNKEHSMKFIQNLSKLSMFYADLTK